MPYIMYLLGDGTIFGVGDTRREVAENSKERVTATVLADMSGWTERMATPEIHMEFRIIGCSNRLAEAVRGDDSDVRFTVHENIAYLDAELPMCDSTSPDPGMRPGDTCELKTHDGSHKRDGHRWSKSSDGSRWEQIIEGVERA